MQGRNADMQQACAMELQASLRGLTKEACKLLDNADNADYVLSISSVVYAALIAGHISLALGLASTQAYRSRNLTSWQHAQLYLTTLDGVSKRAGHAATAALARSCFLWHFLEPWLPLLLTATGTTASPHSQQRPQRQRPPPQQQPQGSEADPAGRRVLRLLAALLQLTPAPQVLQSLARHLSLVSATGPGGGLPASAAAGTRFAARLTAPGADVTAAALIWRFAVPGCSGVAEVLLHLAVTGNPMDGEEEEGEAEEGGLAGGGWRLEGGGGGRKGGLGSGCPESARSSGGGGGRGCSGGSSGGTSRMEEKGRGGVGGPGCDVLASADNERALRLLLAMPPDKEAGASSISGGGAGLGMYDTASIAALLVSVPDRAAGLLSGGATTWSDPWDPLGTASSYGAGAVDVANRTTRSDSASSSSRVSSGNREGDCLSMLVGVTDLEWLLPERFLRRLFQQLQALLRNPRVALAAALTRLRDCFRARWQPLSYTHLAGTAATAAAAGGASATELPRSGVVRVGDGDGTNLDGSDVDVSGLMSDEGWPLLERQVVSAAVRLLAALAERATVRGYVAVVADVFLACTASPLSTQYGEQDASVCNDYSAGGDDHQLRGGCTAALLQLARNNVAATERILAVLLDRAAAAAAAADEDNGHALMMSEHPSEFGLQSSSLSSAEGLPAHQWEALHGGLRPPLSPAALSAAVCALLWLLPPRLAAHPAVSYTLTNRLVLSLNCSPLPYDALQVLVALLPVVYPSAQPATAAATLAAAWGDAAAVTRTSVQRQAYWSVGLLMLLRRLDRTTLEGTPGLLAAVLAGVSARLGGPLEAVRRQAMRVGRGFSFVLDPGSELFGDMGDLGLVAEELWAGALPRTQPRRPAWAHAASSETESGSLRVAAAARGSSGRVAAVGLGSGQGEGDEEQRARERQEGQDGVPQAWTSADGEGGGGGGGGEEEEEEEEGASIRTATDSDDDERGGVGSEDEEGDGGWGEEELRPLGVDGDEGGEDLEGDVEAAGWEAEAPAGLQLRSLGAALRKQDDVTGVLRALKRLEELIRAAPDELGLVAPELVRSLLHCRVPEWAEDEGAGGQQQGAGGEGGVGGGGGAAAQRIRSLVALLAVAPLPAGDALVPEVYSPHLDTHQRLTLLDALAAAAAELADPRVAPRLTLGIGGPPVLQRPTDPRATPALEHPSLRNEPRRLPAAAGGGGRTTGSLSASGAANLCGGGSGSGETSASALTRSSAATASGARGGGPRTRVWAPVAARKAKEREAAAAAAAGAGGSGVGPMGRTFRNRFGDVALRWTAGLLREVDRVKHGVDLLGRDCLLLGRLLTTLAAFAEAAAGTAALPPLANATLELIRSPQVHAHPEPYVRRAALLASGQVLAQLPPPVVAGALLGQGVAGGGRLGAGGGGGGGGGGALGERMEWMAQWAAATSESDLDPHCRLMAQACVNLQADLASRCLTSLQDAASAPAPLAPTLPSLDLAKTARMLTGGANWSLPGTGSGGEPGGRCASAASLLVNDMSAW